MSTVCYLQSEETSQGVKKKSADDKDFKKLKILLGLKFHSQFHQRNLV